MNRPDDFESTVRLGQMGRERGHPLPERTRPPTPWYLGNVDGPKLPWTGPGQSRSTRLTETLIFDPDPQRSTLASHP